MSSKSTDAEVPPHNTHNDTINDAGEDLDDVVATQNRRGRDKAYELESTYDDLSAAKSAL